MLESNFLMVVREMPFYLLAAYEVRYKEEQNDGFIVIRVVEVAKRTFQLLFEIIIYIPNDTSFKFNAQRLDQEFRELSDDETKPLMVYFVSGHDSNGAILGDPVRYYHHYKIRQYGAHFSVTARVVESGDEIFQVLSALQAENPKRKIAAVNIVAHGNRFSIDLPSSNGYTKPLPHLADHATIILDACSTGSGLNSFGETLARKNPGARVFAPESDLAFSKPIFRDGKIESVLHGPSLLWAQASRSFHFG